VTPPELEYVFFSDSGSTSVEVALKMALGFWRHRGEKRTGILALEGAYHGDTIGGMSVGQRGVFNAPYDPCCSTSSGCRFLPRVASRPRWRRSTQPAGAAPSRP